MQWANGSVSAEEIKTFSAAVAESERRAALLGGSFGTSRGRKGFLSPRQAPTDPLRELASMVELLRSAEAELQQQLNHAIDAQATIDADRAHYRQLFESAPDGYVVTDIEGNVIEANGAALALFRCDAPTASGKPLAVFVAPEDRVSFRDLLASARAATRVDSRFAWHGRIQQRAGDARYTDAAIVTTRSPDGRRARLHWSFRDAAGRETPARVTSPIAPAFLAELRRNALLAGFPDAVLQRAARSAAIITARRGEELTPPRPVCGDVFFPLTATLAVVARTQGGDSLELGIVGPGGAVGLMGGPSTVPRAQTSGTLARLSVEAVSEAARESKEVWSLLSHYTAAQSAELACDALCNRYHTLDQRLAKWILTMQDHTGESRFVATHESVSRLLGVRRAGVTVAAGNMARAGLIEYRRGSVMIRDRAGIERLACDCYATIRATYAAVFAAERAPAA